MISDRSVNSFIFVLVSISVPCLCIVVFLFQYVLGLRFSVQRMPVKNEG